MSIWPCVATFFVGLTVGAAGMWFYFLLDVIANPMGTEDVRDER